MAAYDVPCIGIILLLALTAAQSQARVPSSSDEHPGRRELKALVPKQPLVLEYHGGKVLGEGAGINVYFLWYGAFSRGQKNILNGFIKSIELSGGRNPSPSVTSWWKLTAGYKDNRGNAVPAAVKLAGQATDTGSIGKNLKRADLESLVQQALDSKKLPVDAHGLYFLLTAADIAVEDFCTSSCGRHSVLQGSAKLPFAWVGNSGIQCPGMCAWPFAPPAFPGAPATAPAKAPNGDVGIDGMVINVASMLAGASTNPFGNAFYQGDALAPLEAATACTGNYGANSFPGYPATSAPTPPPEATSTCMATGGDGTWYQRCGILPPPPAPCPPKDALPFGDFQLQFC